VGEDDVVAMAEVEPTATVLHGQNDGVDLAGLELFEALQARVWVPLDDVHARP
jgi:hypothetical protein